MRLEKGGACDFPDGRFEIFYRRETKIASYVGE
jgi:hypothetical protein